MTSPAPPRPLVLGVGNRYRGDDGAGPLAADRLAAAGIDAVEHPGDGPGLIEAWQGRESVVVIDAMTSVAPAGTVRRFDAAAAPLPRAAFQMSTHALGLADAIELARTLGRLPPRLVVYGIEGHAFATGTPPGPAVSAAVDRVVARVAAELEQDGGVGLDAG
jgi:hydrogenase maturation protease